MTIYVYYALDSSLVATYSSQRAAVKFDHITAKTLLRYVGSGAVLRGQYILRNTPAPVKCHHGSSCIFDASAPSFARS